MQGIESLKNKGRFGDTELAHLTVGEVVLPPNFLEENPTIKKSIENILEKDDTQLTELMVGSDMVSINPETGLPEFFLKKLSKKIGRYWNKKVKPIVNKIAKVAKFIPGPWQLPAQVYDTGRVAINVAQGDQDFMALVRNLGQAYAFTNIGFKDGQLTADASGTGTKFGGRARDFFRSKFGGGETEAVGTGGETGTEVTGTDTGTGVTGTETVSSDELLNSLKDATQVTGDDVVKEVGKEVLKEGAKEVVEEEAKKNIFQRALSGIGSFFGLDPSVYDPEKGIDKRSFFQRRILDDLLGFDPGGGGIFGSAKDAFDPSKGGLDPRLLALSTAYGKAVQRQLEREAGGLRDIRTTIRPDMRIQTPYSAGFNVDFAKGGLAAFAKGGSVVGESDYAEGGKVLDMREGGESIGPGTGTSDDIPAMLSDGEFVMTAKANLGAGGVKIKKKKGGIMEIAPELEPDRQRGAKNMMKLMRFFEGVA
jgi:hypothetical protein|tara:strand:+ start:965 stop:2401 length:1437 start_codon:yes stop_codon:yes gene_type:complete